MRGWLIGLLLWGGGFYGAWAAPFACQADRVTHPLTACSVEAPPPGVARNGLRWVQLSFHSEKPLERLLGLGVPDAAHAELWVASPGRLAELRWRLDADARFDDRPLPAPRLVFPLRLPEGQSQVWIGYRIQGDGKLSPRLMSLPAARAQQARTDLINGFMAGSLVTLVAVLMAARLLGRSSGYGAYAVLVMVALLMLAQTEGYTFALLWPDAPRWNQLAPTLIALATLAAHAGFALRFLQLRERFRSLWQLHRIFLWLTLLAVPVALLQEQAVAGTAMLGFSYALLAISTAWRAWRAKLLGAPLYLLGTLSLALSGLVLFGLGVLGWNPLPQVDFLDYPKLGLLMEASCFAAALLNRLRLQQQQQADQRLRRLAETEELLAAEGQRRAALELAQQQGLRLAGASHDISQPLASLRFAIEALRRQEANPAITQHLDHTLAYAQTLLSDLIQQTRADLPPQADRIELGPWLADVARQHAAQARAKGLQLRVAHCSVEIEGSQLILARIVNNLLANALRYTQRGGVLLGARRRRGAIELQVWDTGPGLLAGQLARLQRPFERGDSGQPGHGLGLFIVKSLCAQCGYHFAVRTTLGRGSGFLITVPTVWD